MNPLRKHYEKVFNNLDGTPQDDGGTPRNGRGGRTGPPSHPLPRSSSQKEFDDDLRQGRYIQPSLTSEGRLQSARTTYGTARPPNSEQRKAPPPPPATSRTHKGRSRRSGTAATTTTTGRENGSENERENGRENSPNKDKIQEKRTQKAQTARQSNRKAMKHSTDAGLASRTAVHDYVHEKLGAKGLAAVK